MHLIDALSPEEASEAPRTAAKRSPGTKSSKPREAPSAARSEPRGKRADPSKEQVNASVKKSVKTSAVAYLANEEKNRVEKPYRLEVGPLEHGHAPRSLSDLIEQLLTAWVKHKGGNLFEK